MTATKGGLLGKMERNSVGELRCVTVHDGDIPHAGPITEWRTKTKFHIVRNGRTGAGPGVGLTVEVYPRSLCTARLGASANVSDRESVSSWHVVLVPSIPCIEVVLHEEGATN